jgi:isopropylmalate/homocitrate/citramalate synthase
VPAHVQQVGMDAHAAYDDLLTAIRFVSGFLMMSHLADPETLVGQARLMESYGAHCVYVTDSGGRLTMDGIRARVRTYRDVLDPARMASHPPRTPSDRTSLDVARRCPSEQTTSGLKRSRWFRC